MTVYVDDAFIPYRRMLMCHMIADSTEELLDMVDKIGVQRKWIQEEGTYKEHFDICKQKRELAIKNGAVELTWKELGTIMLQRRKAALQKIRELKSSK